MDDSDTRRGGPSTHRRFAAIHRSAGWTGSSENFGAGAAILLGDVSLAWADEMLYDSELPDEALNRAKPTYDRMRTELMAGQYLDLVEQARGGGSVERALRVARFKSAKYTIEGPLHMGGQLAGAGADLLQRFSEYGLPLGEAFQLRDDVLGVFGDPAVTGKPAGDDLREGKRTVLIATTEERCSPAQRHLLSQHLGDRRLSESGIDDIRTVITESGALAHVEELIESLAARAQAALTGLSEPGQSVLRNLALAAVNRSL
jgi:geranylgeranyl diphosphate synthase type I